MLQASPGLRGCASTTLKAFAPKSPYWETGLWVLPILFR